MYVKEFEIRWSDTDANRHLANSAYTNFMSHARMAFLMEYGFSSQELGRFNIGPVVFYEHMYYFKEAFLGQTIKVGLEITGFSEDGKFFKFEHNFYNHKGENIAHCEMLGGWINLKERKLTGLPNELLKLSELFPKSEAYKVLTKEDTRANSKVPKPMNF